MGVDILVRNFVGNHVGSGVRGRAGFSVLLVGLCVVLTSCGAAGGGGGSSPAPTATLTATPMTIWAGSSSSLTFSSTNATSGIINPGANQVGLGGTFSTPPGNGTTTYTYTATGPGGSATATATVTVTPTPPAPTVTLSATPTAALAGAFLTLSWNSTNATTITISGIQSSPIGVPVPSGQNSFQTSATTTYTATAYTADPNQAPATASVTVPVNPINSFTGLGPGPNSPPQDVDPNGAAGTWQYLEYTNTYYQAYDKTTLQPVLPPGGPFAPQPIGTPFTRVANCSNTSIQLDAVVTFDRLASPGRFVIAGKSTRGTGNVGDYYFCIAVSSGDDLSLPTSSWYAYTFDLTSVLGSNSLGPYYPDWPKIGTWPDGADSQEGAYYVAMDMEDQSTQEELGVAVCALDRTNILKGLTMRTPQCFVLTTGTSVDLEHSLIPADVDGPTPPPLGRDEFLVSIQNPPLNGTDITSNSLNLWDCPLDPSWPAAVPPLTYTPMPCTQSSIPLNVPSVTSYIPGCYTLQAPALTYCVPEPPYGTQGELVDSVGDRLMPRLAYRNLLSTSGYESFLVSQTVQTGPGQGSGQNGQQTGINWYEFRDSGSGSPALYQSGTISPDTILFRFLPSIAQDTNGNAAVGYSFSNGTDTMPGIAVSYWNLNATGSTPTESTILNGTGEEISLGINGVNVGVGKWGSYSGMSVDPVDDCTFWYVNEYWPQIATAPWATNIASFQIPGCQ